MPLEPQKLAWQRERPETFVSHVRCFWPWKRSTEGAWWSRHLIGDFCVGNNLLAGGISQSIASDDMWRLTAEAQRRRFQDNSWSHRTHRWGGGGLIWFLVFLMGIGDFDDQEDVLTRFANRSLSPSRLASQNYAMNRVHFGRRASQGMRLKLPVRARTQRQRQVNNATCGSSLAVRP